MAKVGKTIKALRIKNHLTQEDLASKLFVTRQAISNYENEKTSVDIDTLVKLAEIFGCEVEYLIYGERKDLLKKQYLHIIDFILAFVLYIVLLNFARTYASKTFDASPIIFLKMIYMPILVFLLGRYINYQPITFKHQLSKYVHYTIWVIFLVLIITTSCYVIEMVNIHYQSNLALSQGKESFSSLTDATYLFSNVIINIPFVLYDVLVKWFGSLAGLAYDLFFGILGFLSKD